MTLLSTATADDFEALRRHMQRLEVRATAEDAAQDFVNALYASFADSIALVRLFATIPFTELPGADRELVRTKAHEAGVEVVREEAPVLTLLGTRGRAAEWNLRATSQRFRCIPLLSSAYVASLSMLSMQLESMGFPVSNVDAWESAVAASGEAARFRGTLFIEDAGTTRDRRGRMAVPAQDFVHASGIRTVVGIGSGYSRHPTLVTLFVFASEQFPASKVLALPGLLEIFLQRTEDVVVRRRILGVDAEGGARTPAAPARRGPE